MTGCTWRSVALSISLAATVAATACTSAPSVEEASVPSWREEAEFLALPGERRFFLLPLNNPGVVPVSIASHMEPDDLVFGVVVNEQPLAYPRWVMVAYHVVNDTPAHCEACSGSTAFNPVLDGFGDKALTFQIYGNANGTFNVYDYQTQTVWSPFTGRSTEGPMHPTKMDRIPLVLEPWKDWIKRYPDTDVILASRLMIETREHGRGVHSQLGDDFVAPVFAPTANLEDIRLPYGTLIFGITNVQGDQSVAFSLEFLDTQEGLLKYSLAGQDYLLKKVGEFSVVAFRLSEKQRETAFHIVSESPFRLGDEQGSIWDEFGGSVNSGEDRGSLEAADGYFTEWYEWVSSFPQSEIAGS